VILPGDDDYDTARTVCNAAIDRRPGSSCGRREWRTCRRRSTSLHRHLRSYFVEVCRGMLAEGYHREALCWIQPFCTSSCDVILTDGPDAEKPRFAERQTRFLTRFGSESDAARERRFARAHRLYDRIFALAEEIAAGHPGIVD
jgi:hypothetical protein